MMSQSEITQESVFQAMLDEHFALLPSSDPIQKARTKAWEHFLDLGLPTVRSEVFRYLKLKQLFSKTYTQAPASRLTKEDIAKFVIDECRGSVLVFVNGRFQPGLSNWQAVPGRVVIAPLNEAIRTYGTLLNNVWNKNTKEETDPFAALNLALHQEGLFLYVPPKTAVDTPIQILHLADVGDKPVLMMPRVQVFVGMNAELRLITTAESLSGEGYWINQVTECSLDEGAQLQMTQLNEGTPASVWHFDALRATLKRDCVLKTVSATEGAAGIRNDYRVVLTGENGEANLNGVWMLKGSREAHVHVFMDHQAPNCRSMQLFKGVLNDTSRSSFEGKIMVRQAAQKTQAFQLNNNLLLSDKANADSKPNLEIFADDVKASHGATVGQIDSEQLFYMKTRGFEEAQAKNLLVYGFCGEVLDMIPHVSVRKAVSKRANLYLS